MTTGEDRKPLVQLLIKGAFSRLCARLGQVSLWTVRREGGFRCWDPHVRALAKRTCAPLWWWWWRLSRVRPLRLHGLSTPPGSSVHGISQALLCWRHCLIVGSGSHTWELVTAEEASERTVTSPLPRCSSWKKAPKGWSFPALTGVALPLVPKFQTNYWVRFVSPSSFWAPPHPLPVASLQTLPFRKAGRK